MPSITTFGKSSGEKKEEKLLSYICQYNINVFVEPNKAKPGII